MLRKSPSAQDAFLPIPGFTSCAGMTRSGHITCHAHVTLMTGLFNVHLCMQNFVLYMYIVHVQNHFTINTRCFIISYHNNIHVNCTHVIMYVKHVLHMLFLYMYMCRCFAPYAYMYMYLHACTMYMFVFIFTFCRSTPG